MTIKTYVLIQARLGSSRLYQKNLLPIGKSSLIEFCYRNVSLNNEKFKTVVLIPDDNKNKLLEEELKKKKIKYFKGSETNVLLRFGQYLINKQENCNVVRLTSDNPFVDRGFIKFCLKIYEENNLDYFFSHDNLKYNPYGLSVEVFKARKIFESIKNSKTKKNQEHVTTYIKKKYSKKTKFFCRYFKKSCSKLNLSIDNHNDFRVIKRVLEKNKFTNYKNISNISFDKIQDQKGNKSKILIGGVQIGKKYFSNEKITQKRANQILNSAIKNKINFIDTASDYGKSEQFIGNFSLKKNFSFNISTKLTSLKGHKNHNYIRDKITSSVINSLKLLNVDQLDYFFIHNPKDLKKKLIIDELQKFKKTGLIKKLGISIYETKDLKFLKKSIFESIQIPFNLFDHRFIYFIKKNKKFKIFVRSLLLRGNIKKNNILLPKKNKYSTLLKKIELFRKEYNYKNYYDLSFSFINSFKSISYFILGFQKAKQLKLLRSFQRAKPMNKEKLKKILLIIKSSSVSKNIDLRKW